MIKRKISPFGFRTLKKTMVNGIKISLRSFGIKQTPEQERRDMYFEIISSDGGYAKIYNINDALIKYSQMIDFEKRQLIIHME